MTTPPPEKTSPADLPDLADLPVVESDLPLRNRDIDVDLDVDGGVSALCDSKQQQQLQTSQQHDDPDSAPPAKLQSSEQHQVDTPASLTADHPFSTNTTSINDNANASSNDHDNDNTTSPASATETPAQPAITADTADPAKPLSETAKTHDAPSIIETDHTQTQTQTHQPDTTETNGNPAPASEQAKPEIPQIPQIPESESKSESKSEDKSEAKPTEQSAPAAGSAEDDDNNNKKDADGDTTMAGADSSQPTPSLKRSADEMEGDHVHSQPDKQQTPAASSARDIDMANADNLSPGTKIAADKREEQTDNGNGNGNGDEPAAKRAKVEEHELKEEAAAPAPATTAPPAVSTPARTTAPAPATATATADTAASATAAAPAPAEQAQTPAPAPAPVAATPAPAVPAAVTTPGSTIKPEILAHTSSPMTKLQHRFLVRCLSGLKRLHDARFYKDPVDPVKLNIPSYFDIITHPMDMSTIEHRLKGGQYEKVDDVIADFNLMVNNAVTFNGPEHPVAIEGVQLRANFNRHLSKLPGVDEVEPPAPEKKRPGKKSGGSASKSSAAKREPRPSGGRASIGAQGQTFALSPEGLPLIRRDSTAADGRPKRSIHPPKNRDLPYSSKPKKKKYIWELKFCQEALDEMYKNKYVAIASAFYQPVDPVALNIPNYHSIIKKPMDLSTISSKLKANIYENAKEFEADVRLMFKNCYKFNINGDPVYTAGQKLNEVFDRKWAMKDRWLHAHAPPNVRAEHDSAADSDEDVGAGAIDYEENEESEAEVDEEKLAALRRQMEELTKQVEVLSQKKKKTPPATKKKGAAGAGASSKAPRTSGATKKATAAAGKARKGGAATGSGGGAKKEKAARWVSYQEKQLISNVISTLPEKQMNEALSIIQRNAPTLIGSSAEGEIELDIDELPNEVLLKLLNFVKKHAPQAVAELEDAANAPSAYSHHSPPESEPLMPALAGNGRPRKNKPMNASEQEAQINRLEDRLEMFKKGGGSISGASYNGGAPATAVRNVNADVESSDDEDSEESEEE